MEAGNFVVYGWCQLREGIGGGLLLLGILRRMICSCRLLLPFVNFPLSSLLPIAQRRRGILTHYKDAR